MVPYLEKTMEFRQLKYFCAIADSGSISRAAQQVFIAQSALSKQIAELETELHVNLLNRSRSGVTLTEEGKIFYEYAQAIQKQINDARAAVNHASGAICHRVRLRELWNLRCIPREDRGLAISRDASLMPADPMGDVDRENSSNKTSRDLQVTTRATKSYVEQPIRCDTTRWELG